MAKRLQRWADDRLSHARWRTQLRPPITAQHRSWRMRKRVHVEALATMADGVRDGVQDVRSGATESMGGGIQPRYWGLGLNGYCRYRTDSAP